MNSAHTSPSSVPSASCINSRSKNQEDIDQVHLAQRGSLEAFNRLVLDYQDQVYNQAYWMLGDEDAAEDAAQEAFYRAYRKIHTFDGVSFRAWILRITTNYCLDCIRRCKRHPQVPLEPPDEGDDKWNKNTTWLVDSKQSPEQLVEQADRRAFISACLLALSTKDRAPIILVDIQGMDYQEAARILKLPLGSFKSRLSRARGRLLQAVSRAPGSDQFLF